MHPHHEKARANHPEYEKRVRVPDRRLPWAHAWADYTPQHFCAPIVQDHARPINGPFTADEWADPPEADLLAFQDQLRRRVTFCQTPPFGEKGGGDAGGRRHF